MRQDKLEVLDWVKNWLEAENPEFVELVGRLLVSLPGGENLEIFEPLTDYIGRQEAIILKRLLNVIENPSDVVEAIAYLFDVDVDKNKIR